MRRFYCFLLLGWLLVPAARAQVGIRSKTQAVLDGYHLLNESCALPQQIQLITTLHGDSRLDSIKEGSQLNRGTIIGYVQDRPAIRSAAYGLVLAESEAAYEARDFARAAELLREPVQHEPNNPFLLNAYARALYQVPDAKPRSYSAYQQLFRVQEAEYKEHAGEWAVDFWFLEAHWKFGTLCLDNEQWEQSALAMERFMAGYTQLDAPNPKLLEEALGYLTEAFYHLRRPALCRYYGQRTLQLYPANTYVQPYLVALPKAVATPAAKPLAKPRR